jgi:hypothetical protein
VVPEPGRGSQSVPRPLVYVVPAAALILLAVVFPLAAPASAAGLVVTGVFARRAGPATRSLGTVLVALGVLLAIASVVVAAGVIAVDGGGG